MTLPLLWRQGEHVAVIGRTGRGKTHVVNALLEYRHAVVVFKTKEDPEDRTRFFRGYRWVDRARAIHNPRYSRFVVAPRLGDTPDKRLLRQWDEGHALLDLTFKDGGWTVCLDEYWYCENRLGMRAEAETLLTQGRSKALTMVVGMQRPVEISRFALSMATHVFVFSGDSRDAKTVGEALDRRLVPLVAGLQGHDFLYHNTITGEAAVGNARALARVLLPGTGPPRAGYNGAGRAAGAHPGERARSLAEGPTT
jgi:hypothetical protein